MRADRWQAQQQLAGHAVDRWHVKAGMIGADRDIAPQSLDRLVLCGNHKIASISSWLTKGGGEGLRVAARAPGG